MSVLFEHGMYGMYRLVIVFSLSFSLCSWLFFSLVLGFLILSCFSSWSLVLGPWFVSLFSLSSSSSFAGRARALTRGREKERERKREREMRQDERENGDGD